MNSGFPPITLGVARAASLIAYFVMSSPFSDATRVTTDEVGGFGSMARFLTLSPFFSRLWQVDVPQIELTYARHSWVCAM